MTDEAPQPTAEQIEAVARVRSGSIIEYLDDLERHGTLDHAIAQELRYRIHRVIAAMPPSPQAQAAEAVVAAARHVTSFTVLTILGGEYREREEARRQVQGLEAALAAYDAALAGKKQTP